MTEDHWARFRCCCDFCESDADIDAHLARMREQYGKTQAGTPILAPQGWQIVPFGAPIPQVHREWLLEVRPWGAAPRRCHSTMTPLYARPCGHVRAYAEQIT